MDLKRHFVFRGNAAAFNGRLIRPVDIVLDNSCAASLPVVGGRSQSRVAAQQFGDEVRFESAFAFAEGLFDDPKQYEELTYQRGREELLTTTTRVAAEVRGVVVGIKPQLTAARVYAEMHSRSPGASGETPIGVGPGTTIQGLVIDGHRLVVEFNTELFERYNTRAKLLAAADDPHFVKEFGDHLLVASEYVHTTIVRRIHWDGEPFPGSKIDGNLVAVPNLGRLYFGELLITGTSKRLTMIRMELGSPAGGFVACATIEDNGGWSP